MPGMRALPQSPEQLLGELFATFPEYRAGYRGPIHDDTPTYHSVLTAFTPFFGAELASFSEAQLRSFGGLVSAAVEAGGSLEKRIRDLFAGAPSPDSCIAGVPAISIEGRS